MGEGEAEAKHRGASMDVGLADHLVPEAADVDLSSQLEQNLVTNPDNPSHHFNLGIHLWKTGEAARGDESKQFKERAVEHFLASPKLNPSDSTAFRMLGHYYTQVLVDSQRAAKCYQQAVTLNPDYAEAGVSQEGLCYLLSVCREASEKSPRAFWAFRRLRYLLVKQNKWTEAVHSLQSAIRGYPTCADLWEGNAFWRLVGSLLKKPSQEQDDCNSRRLSYLMLVK